MPRLVKHKQPARRLTPKRFLRELGLRRSTIEIERADPSYRAAIEAAGGDLSILDAADPFSAQAIDLWYVTEAVAQRTESGEYDRLLETLEAVVDNPALPPAPRRIADLGGGPGIIAMYFAQVYPASTVTVYDHSSNSIRIGQAWAGRRKLGNIEHIEASYRALAANRNKGDFDVVFFFHGFDLSKNFDRVSDLPKSVAPIARVAQPINAVARLLAKDGVAVINCEWSPLGLMHLFEALRRAGLGVDWRYTYLEGFVEHGRINVFELYVFVRKQLPSLGRSSRDDTLALTESVQFAEGSRTVGSEQVPDHMDRFGDGDKLLTAKTSRTKSPRALQLVQKDGQLLLEMSANGRRKVMLDSMANIVDMLDVAQRRLDAWQRDGVEVTVDVSPRLQRFIDYCRDYTASAV